jgi:hypothetical protein
MEQIQIFLDNNAVTIFIVLMLVTLAIINWPYLVRRPYKDHDKKLKDIEFDSPVAKVIDPIRDCDGYKVSHTKPYDPLVKEALKIKEAPPKPIKKVPVEIKRTQPAKPRQMEIEDDDADDASKFLTQFVAQTHVTSGHSVSGGHTDTHHTSHKCSGSSGHSYSHHDSHSCSSSSDSGSSSSSSGSD